MPKKALTNSEFILKSQKIHNTTYDYSISQYISYDTKLSIICKIHGPFSQTPNNHLHGKGCPLCGHHNTNTKLTISHNKFICDASKIHNNYYDYSLITKYTYVNMTTKTPIICPNHGVFYMTPHNHLQGQRCRKCSKMSKGEHQIHHILTNMNIQFIHEKYFDTCKYVRKLPFDFYIPEHNCCIEYDGEQHFKPIQHFGGEHKYKLTQHRDNIKTKYCIDNNIDLLRISYTDINNIKTIIHQHFNIGV